MLAGTVLGVATIARLVADLQVHQSYASEGPMKLAATLLGGSNDCLLLVFAGADSLKNLAPGFFVLGHKWYGRSSAILLEIGHEQVITVLDELIKKWGFSLEPL